MKYKLIDEAVVNRENDAKINLIALNEDEKIYSFTKLAADIVETLSEKEQDSDELFAFAKGKSNLEEDQLKKDISLLLEKLEEHKLLVKN